MARSSTQFGLLILLLSLNLKGQDKEVNIGPGISPPRLIKKLEPQYSPEARSYGIQGTVLLRMVVTPEGTTSRIQVISPLGYGLDQKAMSAVEKWRFVPATRNNVPVATFATVQVNFRLVGSRAYFDSAFEKRRTAFNVAIRTVGSAAARSDRRAQAIATMQRLAKEDFPAALYMVGTWELDGTLLPKDATAGQIKLERAAKKNYGPALFQIAIRSAELTSKDWDVIRRAALMGSTEAQYFLGDHHERGDGTEKSFGRASNYYRLCASKGISRCQLRLGLLMLDQSARQDYEYEQGLAWLALAAQKGSAEAKKFVDEETPKLDAAQAKRIETLKGQFTSLLH